MHCLIHHFDTYVILIDSKSKNTIHFNIIFSLKHKANLTLHQKITRLQVKMVQKNLICSESAQWFRSPSVQKIPGTLIMPMGMPIMPPLANDHDVAHLQGITVPMNLIWSESANWLLSYSICKILGGLIMPMGMPIMPPWANNHDIAHLQARTVPMSLIWSKSAQWLWSCGIRKITRALIMLMGMPTMAP